MRNQSDLGFLTDRHLSFGGNTQDLAVRQINRTRHQGVGSSGIDLWLGRAIPGGAEQDALAIGSELGAVNRAPLEGELMESRRSRRCASSGQKVSSCQRRPDQQSTYCQLPVPLALLRYDVQTRARTGVAGNCLQIKRDVACRLEALYRVLLQAVPDHAIQAGSEAGDRRVQFRRLFLQDGVHGLHAGVALERALAGQHLVEDGAQSKNVGAMVGALAAHLFRRHVADGAHHVTGSGGGMLLVHGLQVRMGRSQSVVLHQLGQTEVEDLDAAVIQNKNVVRLEVAMHDALLVRRGQTARDLHAVFNRFALGDGPALHVIAQALSFEKFGDQIGHAVLGADVKDGQDVGMIERADHARFLLKTAEPVGVFGKRRWQNFNRHFPSQA